MKLSFWFLISATLILSIVLFGVSKQDEGCDASWTGGTLFEKLELNGVKQLNCVSKEEAKAIEYQKKRQEDSDYIEKRISSFRNKEAIHRARHDPEWYRREIIWRNTLARNGKPLFGSPIDVIDLKDHFFNLQKDVQSIMLGSLKPLSSFEEENDVALCFYEAAFDQAIQDELDQEEKKKEKQTDDAQVELQKEKQEITTEMEDDFVTRLYSSGKKRRRKYRRTKSHAKVVEQPVQVYENDLEVELEKMKGESITFKYIS